MSRGRGTDRPRHTLLRVVWIRAVERLTRAETHPVARLRGLLVRLRTELVWWAVALTARGMSRSVIGPDAAPVAPLALLVFALVVCISRWFLLLREQGDPPPHRMPTHVV